MNDDEEDFPLRHVVLYAKGHYFWDRVLKDLLKITKKINSKEETIQHVIKVITPRVWGAIQEFHEEDVIPGKPDRGPLYAYREQWLLLVSLRNKFEVPWLRYPEFHKLTFEEQKALEQIFQEEFDNRVLQAFISPLAGWLPTMNLGDADGRILQVVSPPKKGKKDKKWGLIINI